MYLSINYTNVFNIHNISATFAVYWLVKDERKGLS